MCPWFLQSNTLLDLKFSDQKFTIYARYQKETRFYTLKMEKDLLNDWVIDAVKGSMGSKRGARRIHACADHQAALIRFADMAKVRCQHKYIITHLMISDNVLFLVVLMLLQTVLSKNKRLTVKPQSAKKRLQTKSKQSPQQLNLELF